MWLSTRATASNRSGIPDRHHVILPVSGSSFTPATMRSGVRVGPHFKLSSLVLSRRENLHVSSADVNCEYVRNSYFAPGGMVQMLNTAYWSPSKIQRRRGSHGSLTPP